VAGVLQILPALIESGTAGLSAFKRDTAERERANPVESWRNRCCGFLGIWARKDSVASKCAAQDSTGLDHFPVPNRRIKLRT
jgi:hypothetical protein